MVGASSLLSDDLFRFPRFVDSSVFVATLGSPSDAVMVVQKGPRKIPRRLLSKASTPPISHRPAFDTC